MSLLVEKLSKYADYHRDDRNVLTHIVGIPMIVLSVVVLLSRPVFEIAGIQLTPASIAFGLVMLFYIRMSVIYGMVMAIMLGACFWVSAQMAGFSTLHWAAWGIGLFVVGWAIQFVGHEFEGRKPAFLDDLVALPVGPLFIVAELGFMMGLGKGVKAQIDEVLDSKITAADGLAAE